MSTKTYKESVTPVDNWKPSKLTTFNRKTSHLHSWGSLMSVGRSMRIKNIYISCCTDIHASQAVSITWTHTCDNLRLSYDLLLWVWESVLFNDFSAAFQTGLFHFSDWLCHHEKDNSDSTSSVSLTTSSLVCKSNVYLMSLGNVYFMC